MTRNVVPPRGQRGIRYGLAIPRHIVWQRSSVHHTAASTGWWARIKIALIRHQALTVLASAAPTLLICLGVLLWSIGNPLGQIGESPILADGDSGALYARVGNTLYPVLNLASARLITGRSDNPHQVRSSAIAALRRGPVVGIPGAPSGFSPTSPVSSSWLVCDALAPVPASGAAPVVTVIDGVPDMSGRQRILGESDAVVLRYGNETWVIRQGRRARVDPPDRSTLSLLGLTPDQLRQVPTMSRALYDALPVDSEFPVLSADLNGQLKVVDMQDNPTTCWWWERTAGEGRARVHVVSAPAVPVAATEVNNFVPLAKSDTSGSAADRFYFGPGYANFVVAVETNPPTPETLFWLENSGVRFGVDATGATRSALGLLAAPSPAPWAALRLLVPGPTLSRASALLRHDAGHGDVSPR
ncbi:type VII secretion protein EccB [Mycobacterium xenopi]|uniref:type VII secretion protein EccB n=1 Tax=Mycobacterium xenopi TaxID=1789 RepID=UPI0005878985